MRENATAGAHAARRMAPVARTCRQAAVTIRAARIGTADRPGGASGGAQRVGRARSTVARATRGMSQRTRPRSARSLSECASSSRLTRTMAARRSAARRSLARMARRVRPNRPVGPGWWLICACMRLFLSTGSHGTFDVALQNRATAEPREPAARSKRLCAGGKTGRDGWACRAGRPLSPGAVVQGTIRPRRGPPAGRPRPPRRGAFRRRRDRRPAPGRGPGAGAVVSAGVGLPRGQDLARGVTR